MREEQGHYFAPVQRIGAKATFTLSRLKFLQRIGWILVEEH